MQATKDASRLPEGKGSYLLFIHLKRRVTLNISRFKGQVVPPGRYIYAGSAYGGGGLRARVGRHLLKDKTCRWHVDHITTQADSVSAIGFVGASECDLRAFVQERGGAVVLPGFGASDCEVCTTHFLKVPQFRPIQDQLHLFGQVEGAGY